MPDEGRPGPSLFRRLVGIGAKKKARIEIQPVLNPISYEKPK
jgi:hypothetical protein